MSSQYRTGSRRKRASLVGLGTTATLLMTGCSMDKAAVGWLPTKAGHPATDNAENLMHLWVGTWSSCCRSYYLGFDAMVHHCLP